MNIGEVIRHWRKARGLTQEQVAQRLGVTPPAVNKWERGVSLPDVALLAPLARLLGISCDTLLTFRENLTTDEINQLCRQAQQKLEKENFADALAWAQKQMAEYPNCEQLALNLAILFDARRVVRPEHNKAAEEWLKNCYEQLLHSQQETIRRQAAEMLFNIYRRQDDYKQAEKYLSYFPADNFQRQQYQALIYSQTGQTDKAWRAYEELLFNTGNRLDLLLHELYLLAKQEKNAAKAQALLEKQKQLARLLDKGFCDEAAAELEQAVWQQDAAATVLIMEQLLQKAETLCAYTQSPLYEHMQFSQLPADFKQNFRERMRAEFARLENFPYIQQDAAAYRR